MKKALKEILAQINEEPLQRSFNITATREEGDEEKYRFELSFSSEDEYARWFGIEILGHKKTEVRMDWIKSGHAPLLLDHTRTQVIGVIEKAYLEDGRGKAVVRFSKGTLGEEVRQDVIDGIRTNVSVGYRVHEMVLEKESDDGNVYRVTDWEPFEVSIVGIPADQTVGVGRSAEPPEPKPTPKKEIDMKTPEEIAAEKAAKEAEAKKAREEARKAELTRMKEINAMAKEHKLEEFARAHIEGETSVAEFQKLALAEIAKRNAAAPLADTSVQGDLSRQDEKDLSKFSFTKALREIGEGTGLTGIEAEMHKQAVQEGRDAGRAVSGNIGIPGMLLQRDLTVTTEGTDVVATGVDGSFIGLLRNKMLVQQLGAQVLTGLTSNVQIPKITAGATASWEGENDAGSEQTQTIGQVSLSPNRVGCYTEVSKQLILQSTPDVEGMVRQDLATAIALAIDSAAISGSGASNQPEGILNVTGIGDVAGGTNGLAPTWDHIVDLESEVAIDNADVGALAYLTNAKVRGKLKKTFVDSGSNAERVWDNRAGNTPLNGYMAGVTNQVPSDLDKGTSTGVCSAIIFGNWADLIVGHFGGLDVVVDPYTLATTNLLRITVNTYADVAVRHAQSFAAMQDALTA